MGFEMLLSTPVNERGQVNRRSLNPLIRVASETPGRVEEFAKKIKKGVDKGARKC